MSYYPYSVKELLITHFGTDVLSAMRPLRNNVFEALEQELILPLRWQYADSCIVDLFLEHRFLIRTEIRDDYIAYVFQQGEKKCVFLMFMIDEAEAPFTIDKEYACTIIREWENSGYEARIVSHCVGIEYYGKSERFHFVHHSTVGLGTAIYKLVRNNDENFLVFDTHSCWPAFYDKVVCVSKMQDIREYECLFEPNVTITIGEEKKKMVIDSGLNAVAKFLSQNKPVRTCFEEFRNTSIFNQRLLAGDKALNIWVNTRNLITEINITAFNPTKVKERDISWNAPSLLMHIPTPVSVRPLDIEQMHGYAVQLIFTDGSIRNYYLKMFEAPEVPDSIIVGGYTFNEAVLKSVSITNEGISFNNGFTVLKHIVFHHGYRQAMSCETQRVFEFGKYRLQSKYRLPLHEFKSHFSAKYYWGNPDECYGPANTLFDQHGKRITDISFSWQGNRSSSGLRRVCAEPTGLYGFLQDDGTWFAPPVYEKAQNFERGCAKVERKVNGTLKQFLITEDGVEISFDYKIDTNFFDGGLCPFNAAAEPVSAPKPGYYWEHDYDDVKAGNWGYVNMSGEIVVEPKYIYVVGFYNGDGLRSVVAKLIDGKLHWGAIDTSGKEVIPCEYESLYTRWGDAFAFRRFGQELYGIMDINGYIIIEPKFKYFEAYDKKHGFLTVGEHEYALGVYSIEAHEMIISAEYDCIDYDDNIISCEIAYTGNERYFDYTGQELDYSAYDRVFENNGLLCVRKGDKLGYIQIDGTVVVPPILTGGSQDDLSLYRKGYMITGDRKQKGLATVRGHQILPQVFSEIVIHDDFVIASKRNDANWCICDALYFYDGTPVLEGSYRRMSFNSKTLELTVETPLGTEVFDLQIEKS